MYVTQSIYKTLWQNMNINNTNPCDESQEKYYRL